MYIYVYIIYICTCIRGLFTKKSFYGETFGGNLLGGVVVHGGTYDQIISKVGGAL